MKKIKAAYAHKILDPQDLACQIHEKRKDEACTIASLNGSFDLLHAGHLSIIMEASDQADFLVVALNTDASIKRYKGEKRPIIDLKNRMAMMASLQFVDYVTWFDEDDPRKWISILKPDVHINGVEYTAECIEASTVLKYGGRLHLAAHIEGLSTTSIIKKIKTL